MSFGIRWTDREIAAGVPGLFGSDRFSSEEVEDQAAGDRAERSRAAGELDPGEWEPVFDEAGAELLVSLLPTTLEVRMRVSQYILEAEKEQIVDGYAKRERLPAEFKAAALRADAVPVLIKSFLAKALGIYPNPEVNSEILDLSSATIRNEFRRPAYERVSDIQKYIHHKAEEARGSGAHLGLPNKFMRYLLSSCRLHLSLQDLFGPSTAYWETIWDAEISASSREVETPSSGFMPADKRRIDHWRAPHKKPLTHYARSRTRTILQSLSNISLERPLDEYRKAALAAVRGEQRTIVKWSYRAPRPGY